eukprot:TRINITY_DN4786_c0_g1_i1.p1 TRINITY_DN4786_c0_g1~~TRINITY_DN4786_c0_g1_i1.p1  ORF type:complete len:1241 (-),score=466.25 TRINITY_DN4786_c0_g1_i1:51-3773(-)
MAAAVEALPPPEADYGFPKGEPPSLSEPLLRVKSGGLGNFMAWVSNTMGNLAASLEAQKDRQGASEEELRSDSRQLKERIGVLEARIDQLPLPSRPVTGHQVALEVVDPNSAGATDVVPSAAESRRGSGLPDFSHGAQSGNEEGGEGSLGLSLPTSVHDKIRQLEESLDYLREQGRKRLSTQEDFMAMRLETVELELTACAKLKDLEQHQQELVDGRHRLEHDLQEIVKSMGQELRAELQVKADELRNDLKAASSLVSQAFGAEGSAAPGSPGAAAAVAARGLVGGGGGGVDTDTKVKRLDDRLSTLETDFDKMAEDFRKIQDAEREKMIAGALENASDEQIAQVLTAVKDASQGGADALQKVKVLRNDVTNLEDKVTAIGVSAGVDPAVLSSPSGDPAMMAAAPAGADGAPEMASRGMFAPVASAGGGGGGVLQGRVGQVEERVEGLVKDVRDLKDAARESMIGAALENASDDQIAQVLKAVKDASQEGGEALAKVLALTNEVRALGVPALAQELQVLRQALADTGAAVPPPSTAVAAVAAGPPLGSSMAGASPSGSPMAGSMRASSPSGRPTTSASEVMQGQLQQLEELHELHTQVQQIAEEIRALREERGLKRGSKEKGGGAAGAEAGAAPAGGGGGGGGKKKKNKGGESNKGAAATAVGAGAASEEVAADGTAVAEAGATDAGEESSPHHLDRQLSAEGGAESSQADSEELDEQQRVMQQRLEELNGKLEALRQSVMEGAGALAQSLPDDERFATLEQRVEEISGRLGMPSMQPSDDAADDGGAAAMAAARSAALAAATAAAGGGGADPATITAAVAAAEAVAANIEPRLAKAIADLEELKGGGGKGKDKAAAKKGAGGGGGGGGKKGGEQGGNKAKAKAGAAAAGAAGATGANAAEGGTGGTDNATLEAVAAVQARADELAAQFEGDGDGDMDGEEEDGEGDGNLAVRLARVESRMSTMASTLDGVLRSQRDGVFGSLGGGGGTPGPGTEVGSFGEMFDVASSPSAAPSPSRGKSPDRLSALENRLKAVAKEVDRFKLTARDVEKLKASMKDNDKLSDKAIAELDNRIETRLTAVWNELTRHAKAAAARADAVERALTVRIEKSETHIVALQAEAAKAQKDRERIEKLEKLMEWVQWRIAWLEWATKGEKGGFSRPLDEKAVIPPPMTNSATAFRQPLTEDMELWTRGKDGKMRLRRQIGATQTQGRGSSAATGGSPHDGLSISNSTGRLPSLVG